MDLASCLKRTLLFLASILLFVSRGTFCFRKDLAMCLYGTFPDFRKEDLSGAFCFVKDLAICLKNSFLFLEGSSYLFKEDLSVFSMHIGACFTGNFRYFLKEFCFCL